MKRAAGGEKALFPALFPRLDLTEVFHTSESNPGRWVEGGTCLCCSSLYLHSPSPSFLRAWLLKAGWQDIYSHPNPLVNHSPLRIILQRFTTFCEPFTPMKHSPLSVKQLLHAIVEKQLLTCNLQSLPYNVCYLFTLLPPKPYKPSIKKVLQVSCSTEMSSGEEDMTCPKKHLVV